MSNRHSHASKAENYYSYCGSVEAAQWRRLSGAPQEYNSLGALDRVSIQLLAYPMTRGDGPARGSVGLVVWDIDLHSAFE